VGRSEATVPATPTKVSGRFRVRFQADPWPERALIWVFPTAAKQRRPQPRSRLAEGVARRVVTAGAEAEPSAPLAERR
jgi:hypothetical protein